MNFRRLKTPSNSVVRLIYHLVLLTKSGRDSLTSEMIDKLEENFALILGKWNCKLFEFGWETNHVHILFEVIPGMDLSN